MSFRSVYGNGGRFFASNSRQGSSYRRFDANIDCRCRADLALSAISRGAGCRGTAVQANFQRNTYAEQDLGHSIAEERSGFCGKRALGGTAGGGNRSLLSHPLFRTSTQAAGSPRLGGFLPGGRQVDTAAGAVRPGDPDRTWRIRRTGSEWPDRSERLDDRGDHVKATRIFEAQPGLAEIFTLTYNPDQNPEFNRFMESRWNELSRKDTTEIRKILTDTERRLQPLDAACMARQCPPDSLAAIPNDADRDIRRKACESICRVPLFTLHAFEAAIPDRFQHFVHTLRSLVHPNGSILLGMCNPGSKVPEREAPWEIGGVLVHSKLASGPHETYVHLLAAATERRVVGPIGKTSAEDIVDRVIRFEEGRPQLYLRIVVPDRRCAP